MLLQRKKGYDVPQTNSAGYLQGLLVNFLIYFMHFCFAGIFQGKKNQGKTDQGLGHIFPVREGKCCRSLLKSDSLAHRNHKAMHDHSVVQLTTFGGKETRCDDLHLNSQFVDAYISFLFQSIVGTEKSGWYMNLGSYEPYVHTYMNLGIDPNRLWEKVGRSQVLSDKMLDSREEIHLRPSLQPTTSIGIFWPSRNLYLD